MFNSLGWVFESNITTKINIVKMYCYVEDVDTFDEVDIDNDFE